MVLTYKQKKKITADIFNLLHNSKRDPADEKKLNQLLKASNLNFKNYLPLFHLVLNFLTGHLNL